MNVFAPMRGRRPHTGGGRSLAEWVVTISPAGQIAVSDGSEGNGATGAGFIVLGNSAATGSIRVGRTEEGTGSTRAEMADLLEVLLGRK